MRVRACVCVCVQVGAPDTTILRDENDEPSGDSEEDVTITDATTLATVKRILRRDIALLHSNTVVNALVKERLRES